MNELILIRHGESKYNAMLTDNLDSELTEKGIEQAKATGRFLKEHFGHINDFVALTSPYLRCLQTSRLIREETGLEFIVTPGPREIMVHYEETKIPARQSEFSDFIWMLPCVSRHWTEAGWHFLKEDGHGFVARMKEFMGTINHEKTLVVSHGTPVGSMFEIKIGKEHTPDTDDYVSNASISYVRNNNPVWFGKKEHLESL